MLVLTRSPFRVSFFGGGTDLPGFFRRGRGAVLGAAIDRYCHLSVSDLPSCFDYRIRVAYSRLELVRAVGEIAHPVVRACLEHHGVEGGIEINHFADLPARTGLGTSSSFTAGLLLALAARAGDAPGPVRLAEDAIRIERERIGEPGGWQDQWFAAEGGLRRLDFRADGTVSVRTPALGEGVAEGLRSSLRLYFAGRARDSAEVIAAQVNRADSNRAALHRMLGLVDEGEAALAAAWDPERFGRLLDASWQLKRSLSDRVSTPAVDSAYAAACAAGAAGGKLLGAGGGGFLLVCVPPDKLAAVRAALGGLYEVPFGISELGARILHREG
ncbi:MAG: kinase [Planctomycetes bacterium]|nr:kinase [Planctomycetota bacterium]